MLKAFILIAAVFFATSADAHHIKRHHSHIGSCDGIHRCRCGTTAADKHGLPWNYNGFNLKRAVEWTHAFTHTTFQVGAVGYVRHGGPSGHVFTVVGGSNCQRATVYDDAGTYKRNVCGATFLSVSNYSSAPVNRQALSRHIARGRGNQESHRATKFLDPGQPVHGDFGESLADRNPART